MTAFHCVLQAAPTELPDFEDISIDGQSLPAMTLPSLDTRFSKSFEEVATAFQKLPRMFFEPDGSFVWVIENESRYQLDGSLYDDGETLLNVELKGSCDADMLDQFLQCLRWPDETVLFQLVQQGVYLFESDFRNHFVLA